MSIIYTMLIFSIVTQGSGMIQLLEPEYTDKSIGECIAARRSIRTFKKKDLDLQQIANLLWAGQGITDNERGFRSAPSAGATYPLVLYYTTVNGLFQYMPESHGVKKISDKDMRKDVARAVLNQMFIADAAMVIVITAIFDNTTWRYGDRGIRYVYNEVGHCAQNIHLMAVALGLGSVPIGAFNDDQVKNLFGLKKPEPVYIIPVGYPK